MHLAAILSATLMARRQGSSEVNWRKNVQSDKQTVMAAQYGESIAFQKVVSIVAFWHGLLSSITRRQGFFW